MSTVTESDLKELRELITSEFTALKSGQAQISEQIKKVEIKQDQLSEQVKNLELGQARLEEKFSAEIKRIDEHLETFNSLIQKMPDLAEKIGEFKNWKLAGSIIVTAFISSILSGLTGGIVGYLIKSSKP